MLKNLNYFISATIPNRKAHSIQVLKMCDALSKYYNTNLICKNLENINIYDNFDLKNHFKIININIYKNRIINFLYKFYCIYFYKFKKDDILYTRDVHYAFFGFFFYKTIYLELHQIYFKKSFLSYYFLKILFKINKIKIIFISNELFRIYKISIGKPKNYIISHDASDNNYKKKKNLEKKKDYL